MKNLKALLICFSVFAFISCSDEDVNMAPREFTVTLSDVNSRASAPTPIRYLGVSWTEAVDPDGDDVVYDIYVNDTLNKTLEKHKELEGEIVALKNLLNEALTAEKRKRMYRGKEIKKKEIPTILKQLEKEELELRQQLTRHDIKCRSLNYIAGKILQSSIGDYVKELGTLIHYAEHTISDLNDIAGKFHNTLHVVLADGRVTSSEMNKLIQVANELYKVIKPVFDESVIVLIVLDVVFNS